MSYGKPTTEEIESLEREIHEKSIQLARLKRAEAPEPVSDYTLEGADGPVCLSELFGDKSDLIVVHNMGESCPYCTLWADGFNGIYPHLADRAAFVLVSPDPVSTQQAFAQSRGWRFPVLSAAASGFTKDMGFDDGGPMPGVSTFRQGDDGAMQRIASAPFGPMDPFAGIWHLFSLLADGPGEWGPRYEY